MTKREKKLRKEIQKILDRLPRASLKLSDADIKQMAKDIVARRQ